MRLSALFHSLQRQRGERSEGEREGWAGLAALMVRVAGWSAGDWWASMTMSESVWKAERSRKKRKLWHFLAPRWANSSEIADSAHWPHWWRDAKMYLEAIVCITAHGEEYKVGPSVIRVPSLSSSLTLPLSYCYGSSTVPNMRFSAWGLVSWTEINLNLLSVQGKHADITQQCVKYASNCTVNPFTLKYIWLMTKYFT